MYIYVLSLYMPIPILSLYCSNLFAKTAASFRSDDHGSGAQLGILRGRGPNQKKGHTPDHSKAVMSSGMSVSLNQKAMALNQGIFFKCLTL